MIAVAVQIGYILPSVLTNAEKGRSQISVKDEADPPRAMKVHGGSGDMRPLSLKLDKT